MALGVTVAHPSGVSSQTGIPVPGLSAEQAEAFTMGREMGFNCNPRRHNTIVGSESLIEGDGDPRTGTAGYVRTAEGTFLVLERYDEQMDGHCLVFAWFGGELEAGAYTVRGLSYAAVEEEVGAERQSFFGTSALRTDGQNSSVIVTSGTLELSTVQSGKMTGSFDLSVFHYDGVERSDDGVWEGFFVAVESDE